jgi:imidazolonepropionase-like amidohydrolase
MRRVSRSFRAVALAGLGAVLTLLSLVPPAVAQTVTVFEHVNVIPMDTERVLQDHTVVVRDGRIAELGPAAQVRAPAGATRVDGRGKYLIPGLAEMHAHVPGTQNQAWQHTVLYLYVAAGVTTIRGMLGQPSHLELKGQVERGEVVGPRIWTSGPSVNGTSVPTADSAVRAATHQRSLGYDLIKIHPGLAREPFDSLDAAADRVGIRYAGHVPAAVGVLRALEAGYWSIDHLDGYVEELAGRSGQPGGGWFGVQFTGEVDESRIAELARRTREAGVWNVATQTLMESVAQARDLTALNARPELRYMPPQVRQQWNTFTTNAGANLPAPDVVARWIEVRRQLIKALQDQGAGLLLGSDAPQVWNVPGFAIHHELEAMVAAGLTPFQALATGTRNVATYFGTTDRAGTIAVGKQADLILLDANPLANIAHTTRRSGVMLRGVWMPQAEIQQRLDAIAAGYGT